MAQIEVDPNYGFSVLKAETWDEAKEQFRQFGSNWIFRGQAQSDWLLTTSLERITGWTPGSPLEGEIFDAFSRQAHNYLEPQSVPQGDIEWWALMQHHGVPTRLLDWTRSAYVGAFFAIDEADGDCALWALDGNWCQRTATEIARRQMPNAVPDVLENDGFLREISHIWRVFDERSSSELSFVFPVNPKR